jgi:hypothetical protein
MGLKPTTTGITISGVDQALARVPGSRGNECRTIKHHSARVAGVLFPRNDADVEPGDPPMTSRVPGRGVLVVRLAFTPRPQPPFASSPRAGSEALLRNLQQRREQFVRRVRSDLGVPASSRRGLFSRRSSGNG